MVSTARVSATSFFFQRGLDPIRWGESCVFSPEISLSSIGLGVGASFLRLQTFFCLQSVDLGLDANRFVFQPPLQAVLSCVMSNRRNEASTFRPPKTYPSSSGLGTGASCLHL